MRRILVGFGGASAAALMFAVPEVGGIATWKCVLAAMGLVLIVVAGRGDRQPRR